MTQAYDIFGIHAVAALLEKHPEKVLNLFMANTDNNPRLNALAELAKSHGIPVDNTQRKRLDEWSNGARHQGVFAKARYMPSAYSDLDAFLTAIPDMDHTPIVLAFDGLQDPHNLGACLRSAEAFGVDAILLPKQRNVSITPVVRKVASGATETLNIFTVPNLARALKSCQSNGLWVVGATQDAPETATQADLAMPIVLVMGAEEKGLRPLTAEYCDLNVSIPMQGEMQSLNVSVATGVLLYEIQRQKSLK